MSQVHYEEVGLDELMRAEFIAVVKDLKTEDKTVPVQGCPDFGFRVVTFEVLECLKGELPKTITVEPSTFAMDRSMHIEYHVNDMMVSPIYQQFPAGPRGESCIVFLRKGVQEPYAFVVEGSWVPLERKEEILKKISSQ